MRYDNYRAEDFLTDTTFQKYCLGTDTGAVLFWEEWIKTHPEKRKETERAKQLYYLLNGNNTRFRFEADESKFKTVVEQLMNTGSGPVREKKIRKLFSSGRIIAVAAAACVLMAAGLLKLLMKDDHAKRSVASVITSGAGEHKSILLPDGSRVTLNEKSSLHVPEDFNGTTRAITLSGEAFFDVTHDASRPFVIHTSYIDVNVLGTVLNVEAYPGEQFMETSLLKGSVELILKKQPDRRVVLKPNEKVSINYNAMGNTYNTFNIAQNKMNLSAGKIASISGQKEDTSLLRILWSKSSLEFNNNTLEEIALQLQQWYGITINFENDVVKQYRFTGNFKDKSITQVLDFLQLSRHFNYEIDENSIIYIKE